MKSKVEISENHESNLKELLTEVRELILSSRGAASHSIDIIQVAANFEIGRRIVETKTS